MHTYHKSRFTVVITIRYGDTEWAAVYNTLSGAFVLIPREDWTALIHNGAIRSDPATVEHLLQQGILVKVGTDETLVYQNWRLQHVYSPSTIKSKMIVSRRCNMRCKYCLIDKESRDMKSEVAGEIDKFFLGVIREARPLMVSDEAGGTETMLNAGVLIESATRRFHFCQGLGIPYNLSMITNGTLLDRHTIERLIEVGLARVRVSVAGPARIHDALRPFKGGGGTHGIIMRNLAAISGLVPIMIECQYDSASRDYEDVPEMFDDFDLYGIAVDRVRFCPILRTRTNSPFQSGFGDPQIYLCLIAEAKKRGYSQFDHTPSNRCAADFRYNYVFDTGGELMPCPALQGGELAYGHARTGIDFIAESQLLMRKLPDKCLNDCSLLGVCGGGCRAQALVTGGDFNGIDCRYDTLLVFLEAYIREKAEETLASTGEEAITHDRKPAPEAYLIGGRMSEHRQKHPTDR
ncbi:MAG TPA: radical SAM protein [Syntrophobacteraceae bacterium]|nr:radical SAM protein [Syntrophobacteraceae bacterium]